MVNREIIACCRSHLTGLIRSKENSKDVFWRDKNTSNANRTMQG